MTYDEIEQAERKLAENLRDERMARAIATSKVPQRYRPQLRLRLANLWQRFDVGDE